MRILFSPAGDTDPVRGYHDGAMLHILRHYPVDKVIVFLTNDMEQKEHDFGCYSKGIEDVGGDCPKEFIESHITQPQDFEALGVLLEEFDRAYKNNPDAEWLLNVSSGTPQIKAIMTLLALDYERATAIHVDTPEKKSNRNNRACATAEELVEMLDCNEDNGPEAINRCKEPPLSLLRRHGLKLQIESLIKNYDYDGALQMLKTAPNLFTRTTHQLLQHGVYRVNLRWRDANKEISHYKGKVLIQQAQSFSEYFQIMELQQRKGQLGDFILKLSPVLVKLAWAYLQKTTGFSIENCYNENRDKDRRYLNRENFQKHYPEVLAYVEKQFGKKLNNGDFKFVIAVYICQSLAEQALQNDKTHKTITELFTQLRYVEKSARNALAHTITNITEEELVRLQKIEYLKDRNQYKNWKEMQPKKQNMVLAEMPYKGMNSKKIVDSLHQSVKLIKKQDIPWSYDDLNSCIIDSLQEMP